MIKQKEIECSDSCWNRAKDNELIFVLLGRDAAAPVAVRAWIEERIRTGKNLRDDAKIQEAEEWAKKVESLWK